MPLKTTTKRNGNVNRIYHRPHSGPLPQERVNRSPRLGEMDALTIKARSEMSVRAAAIATKMLKFSKSAALLLPLPGGEGRGEGERSTN